MLNAQNGGGSGRAPPQKVRAKRALCLDLSHFVLICRSDKSRQSRDKSRYHARGHAIKALRGKRRGRISSTRAIPNDRGADHRLRCDEPLDRIDVHGATHPVGLLTLSGSARSSFPHKPRKSLSTHTSISNESSDMGFIIKPSSMRTCILHFLRFLLGQQTMMTSCATCK